MRNTNNGAWSLLWIRGLIFPFIVAVREKIPRHHEPNRIEFKVFRYTILVHHVSFRTCVFEYRNTTCSSLDDLHPHTLFIFSSSTTCCVHAKKLLRFYCGDNFTVVVCIRLVCSCCPQSLLLLFPPWKRFPTVVVDRTDPHTAGVLDERPHPGTRGRRYHWWSDRWCEQGGDLYPQHH